MGRALLAALLVLVGVARADAACTGSGLVWTCDTSTTKANVNTAIGSATSGATITFDAGTYTWTAAGTITPSASKSVTLICVSVGACDVNLGSVAFFQHDDITGTSEGSHPTWRLSGFDFTGACSQACIWFYPRSAQATQWLTLRIDHNTFTDVGNGGSTDFMLLGENSRPMVFLGVIDHNTFSFSIQGRIVVHGLLEPDDWSGSLMGADNPESGNCLFFEDNSVTFTAPTNSGAGFIDAKNQACYVFRFNTDLNARILQHSVGHAWGTANWELYGNTFERTSNADTLGNCYRTIHGQGAGTLAVWGNTFVDCVGTISSGAIALLHYRDGTPADAGYGIAGQCDGDDPVDGNTTPTATHFGYPCKKQPGRAPAGGTPDWGTLSPVPAFKNIDASNSNAKVDLEFGCPWTAPTVYCTQHVVNDRDYYNAVSASAQTNATTPFNGTTGIGHGTLANRPTTCTHNTSPDGDNGGGVMYWATDQGSWNSSSTNPFGVQQNGADGVLYRCSATDTWSVYYTPYAYPHPLQGAVAATGAPYRLRVRDDD